MPEEKKGPWFVPTQMTAVEAGATSPLIPGLLTIFCGGISLHYSLEGNVCPAFLTWTLTLLVYVTWTMMLSIRRTTRRQWWQMHLAPGDGRNILIRHRVRMHDIDHVFISEGWWCENDQEWQTALGCETIAEPLGWMPVPEPPTEEKT